MGEGTGGVTEAYKRRIVLPLAGPIQLTDHVLGHELVHAFQYDITNTNVSSGNGGALNLPLWFIEGMAEYLSIGPVDAHTAMWMRESARRESLPEIDKLDDPRYFPYRYGHALWAYIGGRFGDEVIGDMLRAGGASRAGYAAAFEGVLQVDTKELSKEWHNALFQAYLPIAESTKMPGADGAPGDQEAARRGDERQPRGEPGRLEGDLLLGARPLLDRSLCRRRKDRRGPAQGDRHRDQRPHREPAVHLLGRIVGSDQQEIRVSWHRQRTFGAHNCGRRTGQEGAGAHRRRGRRSDESDLVARRQHDRLFGAGWRVHGPVPLRPQWRPAETSDHGSVRGARSVLVARWPDAGVQHRSIHDQPADARGRRPASGDPRRRVGGRQARRGLRRRRRTSARSGRRTAARSTSSPIVAASRTSTAWSSVARPSS